MNVIHPASVSVALREAWRNITSGTSRVAFVASLLALCMAGLMGADLAQLLQLARGVARFTDAGAATYVITAPDDIDGAACESLAGVDGVRAAGALRQATAKITFNSLPSAGIPAYEVTNSAVELFDAAADTGSGVLLSHDVAETLGADVGDDLASANGTVHVRGVYAYPDDGRDGQYSYAVLEPVDSGKPFDACMVSTWPIPDGIDSLLYLAVSHQDAEAKPKISLLNSSLGTNAPSERLFAQRITAFAPLAMAVIGWMAGFGSVRSRRLELASALHAGYRKVMLCDQIMVELSAAAMAATLLCSPVMAYAMLMMPETDLKAVSDALLRIPVSGFLGLVCGGVIGVAAVSERQLFVYFKQR